MHTEIQFRNMLDSLMEGIQIIDHDWNYRYLNKIALEHAKRPAEELLGYSIMECFPGIEDSDIFLLMKAAMDDFKTSRIENKFTYPDGSEKWFDLTIEPAEEGICILTIDITDIKLAADLVARKEQRFRHTLDSMLEGAQIHDFNWNYLYVNDALVKFSTYTRGELLGHTIMEKYPGIQKTEIFKTMQRCMDKRESAVTETEFVFPNGTKAWFELNIQPIPEGIFILSVDHTEQQKAKEKVLILNRVYAFISAINQSIVHIKDEDLLLQNTCNVATNIGKFTMAWIGFFDAERKFIQLVAQSGIENEHLSLFSNAELNEDSPSEYVMRTGRHYSCGDISKDPKLEKWLPFAANYGILSGIVMPLTRAGVVVGTINLYADKLHFADKAEIDLLDEVTGDISFALDNFDKEKKHLETELLLAANEQRFRALIEKSPDLKTLTTAEGVILYGSPAITKTLGHLPGDFIGTSIVSYVNPKYQQEFVTKRTFILNKPGESFQFQWPLLHKDGNWIWCRGTVTNMLHVKGVNAFVANFLDVTEKKLVERQRFFDDKNLKALINNTNDLMWSVDIQMNLITANERFDEMVTTFNGQTIEKGGNVLEGASIAQQERFKRYYLRAFSGEAFKIIEHTTAPFELYSEISFYPIRGGRDVIGTACYSRDITEMKKMEQQLIKSEAFNREVLNSLSAHIAVIDKLGNIVSVNEAWKRFGRDNERVFDNGEEKSNYFDVCGQSAQMGETIAAEVVIGIKNVMAHKMSSFYLEYPCHSATDERWFAMLAKQFEGDEDLVVVAHQDISARKLAEEKIIRSNEELRKTNFELDRFAYSVSHDLRAPLTSILGLTTFIEEESQEEKTLEHAGMIRQRIANLDGFIKNILNYSRNNRTELEIEAIPVSTIADGIVESLRNAKGAENINFNTAIIESAPFYSDLRSLKTILENLISNAIKFKSQKGQATININGKSGKDSLQLTITDNGIGIEKKHLHKIYDMFFRLSGSVDGSGIGLYIVKEIVEKLQGTITVKSEPGKGTTFVVTLKNLRP